MNEVLFPKPLPADPIPLDLWLDDTDRSEVGREPFFRGRDKEYAVFQTAANLLKAGRIGGGTMIFQGAPGVGKTALMLESMEAVRQHSTPSDPWVAVNIKPENLESAMEVVMLLVDAANGESERLSEISSGNGAKRLESIIEIGRKVYRELSDRGVGIDGSGGGKLKNDQEARVYSQRVFQNASGFLKNFHTVVFVDEAQNTPVKDTTKGVLDCLHNPPDKIPLLAAFYGLSDTEGRLTECGISRPAAERVVSLEVLTREDASEAIKGVFEAYNFAGLREDFEIWVKQLTELSQGWPQHINRVSVAVSRVIADNGGLINGGLLEQALEGAQQHKESYYAMILRRCSGQLWVYKKLGMVAREKNGILSLDEILRIAKFARTRQGKPVEDFLTDALHAGVLIETREPPNRYRIPIPSFGDYLRSLPEDLPAGT